MSRTEEKGSKFTERSRELEKTLFGSDSLKLANLAPAANKGLKVGAFEAAEIPTLYEHDKQAHPEASTTEHMLATAAHIAAEGAVKYAALKGGKYAPVLSAPAGMIGKTANEAVHELFDAHRPPTTAELAQTAQTQIAFEQQLRSERFQEKLAASDRTANYYPNVLGNHIRIIVHDKKVTDHNVIYDARWDYSATTVEVHSKHTDEKKSFQLIDFNSEKTELFKSFHANDTVEILFEKNNEIVTLPEATSRNLIEYFKKGMPLDRYKYCCMDFAAEMIAGRDPNQKYDAHSVYLIEKELKTGDLIFLISEKGDENGTDVHAAVYLSQQQYISMFGVRGPLVVTTVNEMNKCFGTSRGAQVTALLRSNTAPDVINVISHQPNPKAATEGMHGVPVLSWSPAALMPAIFSSCLHAETMPVNQPMRPALTQAPISPVAKAYQATASAVASPIPTDISKIYSQALDAVTQPLSLYQNINVPLPSKPISIQATDTVDEVCMEIDRYFEDIIRDYPKTTQQLVRDIYYDPQNKYRDSSKNTLKVGEDSNLANWHLDYDKEGAHFKWTLDSRLLNCPVTIRVCKIHEIAIHIGQAHQRLEQVGASIFFPEVNAFNKFTEQSVALSEKILRDALPEEIISRDLENIGDSLIREKMKGHYAGQLTTVDDYVHLSHRRHDHLTPSHHEAFLANPQVSSFLKTTVQQFYPGMDITVASTAVYRKALEETVHAFRTMPTPSYPTEKKSQAKPSEEKGVSAYEDALKKTVQANREIPIPVYQASSVTPQKIPPITHAKTNAATALLNKAEIKKLQKPIQEATIAMRDRGQFQQGLKAAQINQTVHSAKIMHSTASAFSLAATVFQLTGNSAGAQFCSSIAQVASGVSGWLSASASITIAGQITASTFFGVLTGGLSILAGFASLIGLFNNQAAEEARRFKKMIETAMHSFNDLDHNTRHELNEFFKTLTEEIHHVGALADQVIAEQNQIDYLSHQVFTGLAHLHQLMGAHFESTNAYLHVLLTGNLKTSCTNLSSYLNEPHGVQSSLKEIRNDLHQLEFWIMARLHHPVMNVSLYANASDEDAIAIFSQQSHPLISIPGFFAGRMQRVLQSVSSDCMSLPPMTLFFPAIQLYFKTLEKHPDMLSGNKGESVFSHIRATLKSYGELIQLLKDNESRIKESQLLPAEKEILLKPLSEISAYETAINEMNEVLTYYEKRLQFLTDPQKQLETFTNAFFNANEKAVFWVKNSDNIIAQNGFFMMPCKAFYNLTEQRQFIQKLEKTGIKVIVTTTVVNNERFLQAQLMKTAASVSDKSPSFFFNNANSTQSSTPSTTPQP